MQILFNRENLSKRVVILREPKHLDKLCKDLKIYTVTLTVQKFPMIVYEDQAKSIDVSEIDEDKIDQLKKENLYGRTVLEYNSVASGLADNMEANRG